MLQAVLFGFGGLDITANGIETLETQLPKAWNSLIISGVGIEEKMYTNN